ncbi:MAG: Asp-tRNA(Asn)/Glu-tRNA(Gln) amidotransferase subunit GatA [Candidatus Roizmanbacteria bacterium]|nr:Asp-tRNA(Asn)/Glu-tRNA(Gln) amidotransferase subunit GatA [Candidatus Roizmanbacteria bacterium]
MTMFGTSITQLRELIQSKKVSPNEVWEYFAKRSKLNDEKLDIFITRLDTPVQNVDSLDLPLAGIPFSMKDTYNTKGIRTTAASKVLDDYIPQFSATVYQRLINAGAMLVGKTNCDAWGHGSSTENSDYKITKNPWNTEYVAGGSSGGSAVAVATNSTVFDIGEDTGGSIRLPASFCGIIGLKVTYGLISRYGCVAYASSLDTVGPMAASVEDIATVLEVIAGNDPYDGTSTPIKSFEYKKTLNDSIEGLKIGVPKEYMTDGIDDDVRKRVEESLEVYRKLGATIKKISLPHTKYAISTYYLLATSETSSNLARYDGIRYGNSRAEFGPEAMRRIMLGSYTLSAGYYDQYYKKALKVRTKIQEDFEQAFKEVDIIAAPVSPTPAFKIGEKASDPLQMYLSDVLTVSINIAGIPSLSVPVGLTSNTLPVGMQLIGNHFEEAKLLNVARKFEQETNFFDVIKKGERKV